MSSIGKKLFGRGENRVTPVDKKKIIDNSKTKDNSKNKEKGSKFRLFRKKVKQDKDKTFRHAISETTSEIWLTFLFTFVVGSFLLGGGIYLIYDGSTDNVVDFVVLGSFGILMGVCFSSVGLYLFFKPICDARKDKKARQRTAKLNEHIETMKQKQEPSYFTENEARIMNQQVDGKLVDRNLGNEDLYGQENKPGVKGGSRSTSSSSSASYYEPPPPLAVPSQDADAYDVKKAVKLMEVRESTEDDIVAILQAATANDIRSGHKPSPIAAIAEVSRESTPVFVIDHSQENDLNEPSLHSPKREDSPVRLEDSSAPVVETALFELFNKEHAEKYVKEQKERGNANDDSDETSSNEEVLHEEDTPRKKKRVLSAVNERRSASGRRGSGEIRHSQDNESTGSNTSFHGNDELVGDNADSSAGNSLQVPVKVDDAEGTNSKLS